MTDGRSVATWRFGPFRFDPSGGLLYRGEEEIPLPPRVSAVLELLLERGGQVVRRQELIERVWKDAFVTDTSLAEAVSVLRQALGDDPQSPRFIQTVHRRGYRFIAPIERHEGNTRSGPAAEATVDAQPRVAPSIGRELLPWSAAALFGALAIAATWQLASSGRATPRVARFAIAPAPGTWFDDRAPALAISHDGSRVAWAGCDRSSCRLYVHPIDRLDVKALDGTEGASAPFFSPDGAWLGFFADGKLKKIAVAGGAPLTIADVPEPSGGTWSASGDIVYAGSPSSGLLRVSDEGGEPQALTVPREDHGEVRHAWPAFADDGRTLVFTIVTGPGKEASGRVGVLSFNGVPARAAWRSFLNGIGVARPSRAGAIVFSRDDELLAIAFDRARLEISSVPHLVVSRLGTAGTAAQFDTAGADGTLVYAETGPPPPDGGLVWWTPAGVVPASNAAAAAWTPSLAPDGRRIALVVRDGDRSDIWVGGLDGRPATRLTNEGVNASAVWSPDGRSVYFARRTSGAFEIWRRDADGVSAAVRVLAGQRHAVPVAISPDGGTLAFTRTGDGTRLDLWALPLKAAAQPRILVQSPFDDAGAAWSPDGQLLAYQSNESGRWEVYVQRLSDRRRTIVSAGGGTTPSWSPDGTTIYYHTGDRLMGAAVAASDLRAGVPALVTQVTGMTPVTVAPDGRVLLRPRREAPAERAIVVLNWDRELRQLLGPPTAALPR